MIDPIGTVPAFIAATVGMSARARRRIAMRASLVSAGILPASIVVGQFVLEQLEIDFAAFRVAGGVRLFLFALDMIFGESTPEHELAEVEKHAEDDLDAGIDPLAIPSIAGPGSIMAVIVRTGDAQYTFVEQATTTAVVGVVLVLVFVAMLGAARIQRVIGDVGAGVVSRVMGMLFAAMAADGVLTGVRDFFGTAAG